MPREPDALDREIERAKAEATSQGIDFPSRADHRILLAAAKDPNERTTFNACAAKDAANRQ
jgi:hypothetical protein